MLLFELFIKKTQGFYKMRLKTEKFTHTIAIYAKITQFFNNEKLWGNLRDRIIT